MAYKITEECITCGACEGECPNKAISEGTSTYQIDPDRCTECVGANNTSKCAEVCPVDACRPDPAHKKTAEQLLTKWYKLHPDEEEKKKGDDTLTEKLIFKCSGCGQVYILGENALVATVSGMMGGAKGFTILGTGGSLVDNHSNPDLVGLLRRDWNSLDQPEMNEQLVEIRRISAQLKSGQSRWWRCRECDAVQTYVLSEKPLDNKKTAEPNDKEQSKPQPDYFIIRLNKTNVLPVEQLITAAIEANGYQVGGNVDFKFTNSIDDAYMTGLYLVHQNESGKKVDTVKSKMHNVSGKATGKLIAIFYEK
jgi:hypothetical protein